jgi:hypothetical protein
MAAPPEPARQADALRPTVQAAAKNLAAHLGGPDGPAWGTPVDDLEELAVRLGQDLAVELLRLGLARQAQGGPPPGAERCPRCGGPLTGAASEPRAVTTRAGDSGWQEPQRSCGRCRKAFFPSVQEPGP